MRARAKTRTPEAYAYCQRIIWLIPDAHERHERAGTEHTAVADYDWHEWC